MKKIFFLFLIIFPSPIIIFSQSLQELKEKVKKINIEHIKGYSFTENEAASAIKEALNQGVEDGVKILGKKDGYFENTYVKIPFPKDLRRVEEKMKKLGMHKQVNNVILSINRAAEDAVILAKPIFFDAIKNMSILDARSIISGKKSAATDYLYSKTHVSLIEEFQPFIKTSLEKVNATKYWKSLIESYNKIPFVKKVNPNLEVYVTKKAIDGLFFMLEKEEELIRNNPKKRVSELLKKVFGK